MLCIDTRDSKKGDYVDNYVYFDVFMRSKVLTDTCSIADTDNWWNKTAVGVKLPTGAHCVSVLSLTGTAGSNCSIF